jgi:alkylhydroperoxidase family enzyme
MSAPTPTGDVADPVTAMLQQAKAASGGRLLALHTDLARSPATLAAYLGLRRAGGDYGTLPPAVRATIMLTAGMVDGGDYSQAIATQLALGAGMSPQETVAVRVGHVDDARTAALLAVIREAAGNIGVVSTATWDAASAAVWSDEQLIEAFVYLALTVFVDYFTNFARTELDVPPAPPITTGEQR